MRARPGISRLFRRTAVLWISFEKAAKKRCKGSQRSSTQGIGPAARRQRFPEPRRPDRRRRQRAGTALLRRRRLLAVGFQPPIDQGNAAVDLGMAETLFAGNQLHQLVGAFDEG